MLRKSFSVAAAAALAVAPVAVHASPASVATTQVRAASDMQDASELGRVRNEGTSQFVLLVVIAAIIFGLTQLLDSESPDSP